jgi:hypothetical protein
MKAFNRTTIASCISLIILFLTIWPAAAVDGNTTSAGTSVISVVEVRGPVYNGSDIDDIFANQGTNGAIIMDATNFTAFYYDINDNVTTESLSIKNVLGTDNMTL